MVIPGGELGKGKTHGHQSQGIELSSWEPGILHIVTTHSHNDACPLQLTNRRQRPAQRCLVIVVPTQPSIGERQGDHLKVLKGHTGG